MTLKPRNSDMFFAYHIRSAYLTFEDVLRDMLSEREISLEHFYVLRCDWKTAGIAFDDIMAHAMLTREVALQTVSDLISKGYIKEDENGLYALSSQGVNLRTQLLEAYRSQLSKATEGLSKFDIETALSGLLKVQNNLQQD